jgi:hypothetical protein
MSSQAVANPVRPSERAGRACPLHYRYRPEVFDAAAPADLQGLEVLYVVGGLYGHPLALEQVLEMFEQERGRKRLVFNGDFHWFDVEPALFAQVQRGVLNHRALRGNVETELAAERPAAGAADCGCAYPDWVGDEVVERSNQIITRLRGVTTAPQRAELAALPMWLRADVGALRLGIVHGDAQSLAGWGFSQEHLGAEPHRAVVRDWFARAAVDAFASSHSCLPVYQSLRAADSGAAPRWVFNNGAAGMPNFRGDGAGLLTRIALAPCGARQRRFGVRVGGLFVDALAIEVDSLAWQALFERVWPPGSAAHASYFDRIVRGPSYGPELAVRYEE